jgi:hypothetical protein
MNPPWLVPRRGKFTEAAVVDVIALSVDALKVTDFGLVVKAVLVEKLRRLQGLRCLVTTSSILAIFAASLQILRCDTICTAELEVCL